MASAARVRIPLLTDVFVVSNRCRAFYLLSFPEDQDQDDGIAHQLTRDMYIVILSFLVRQTEQQYETNAGEYRQAMMTWLSR